MPTTKRVRLSGSGPNAHWHVPLALETLQGLQSSCLLLVHELDKHLQQRDSGGGKHPEAIGTAVAATVMVAYAVEVAIKTLIAQSRPGEPPPFGHDLLTLFDTLDETAQAAVGAALKDMVPVGEAAWIGENPDARSILKAGRKNFVDWRYLPEAGASGGVPKALINVLYAVQQVCVARVDTSETGAPRSAKIQPGRLLK